MKIDGIGNIKSINNLQIQKNLERKKDSEEKKVGPSKKEKVEPAAVYEKSRAEDNTHVYDRVSIERLKKEF